MGSVTRQIDVRAGEHRRVVRSGKSGGFVCMGSRGVVWWLVLLF